MRLKAGVLHLFQRQAGARPQGHAWGQGMEFLPPTEDRSCPSLPKSEDTGTLLIQAAHLLSCEPEATGFSHLVSAVT